jgi:hypothetical protein
MRTRMRTRNGEERKLTFPFDFPCALEDITVPSASMPVVDETIDIRLDQCMHYVSAQAAQCKLNSRRLAILHYLPSLCLSSLHGPHSPHLPLEQVHNVCRTHHWKLRALMNEGPARLLSVNLADGNDGAGLNCDHSQLVAQGRCQEAMFDYLTLPTLFQFVGFFQRQIPRYSRQSAV